MAIWLIEGLPGAGKSTLARNLCELATGAGYRAKWYLEEAHAHPIHPKALRTQRSHGAHFARASLDAWAAFVATSDREVIHILEGSAFQSSVRFMFEERYEGIIDYFKQFEEVVAPLRPSFVYLRSRQPHRHSQLTSQLRGKLWSTKVSGYLESTPCSQARGWAGLSGMHHFWQDYADLCDVLVAGTKLRTKTIEFDPGDWSKHMPEAANFFRLIGAAREVRR